MTSVNLMKSKSDLFSCFKSFHKMVCTQFNAKVQFFRTGNGTKYNFDAYLDSYGIVHQTNCPSTSAQNGVTERKNQYLLEVT